MKLSALFPAFLFLLGAFPLLLRAEEAIPKPYPVERYEAIWKHSPFTLSSAPEATAAPGENEKLILLGILRIGNQAYAEVVDKETQKRFMVSEEASIQNGDLHLVRLDAETNPDDPVATLERGGRTFQLHYDATYLKQKASTPFPTAMPSNVSNIPSPTSAPPAAAQPPVVRRVVIPAPQGANHPAPPPNPSP